MSDHLLSFAVGTGSWCSGLTCQPVTLETAGSNPVEPAIAHSRRIPLSSSSGVTARTRPGHARTGYGADSRRVTRATTVGRELEADLFPRAGACSRPGTIQAPTMPKGGSRRASLRVAVAPRETRKNWAGDARQPGFLTYVSGSHARRDLAAGRSRIWAVLSSFPPQEQGFPRECGLHGCGRPGNGRPHAQKRRAFLIHVARADTWHVAAAGPAPAGARAPPAPAPRAFPFR
jgi:hypothetical protein